MSVCLSSEQFGINTCVAWTVSCVSSQQHRCFLWGHLLCFYLPLGRSAHSHNQYRQDIWIKIHKHKCIQMHKHTHRPMPETPGCHEYYSALLGKMCCLTHTHKHAHIHAQTYTQAHAWDARLPWVLQRFTWQDALLSIASGVGCVEWAVQGGVGQEWATHEVSMLIICQFKSAKRCVFYFFEWQAILSGISHSWRCSVSVIFEKCLADMFCHWFLLSFILLRDVQWSERV